MKFKRSAVALAVGSAVLSVATMGAAPAEAAGSIQFRRFYYDSPGSDRGSNTSLNAEYFDLKNVGTTTRDLSGWKVRDKAGYVYTFPTGSSLRAGYSVRVHTGKGTNSSTHKYWGRSWYVWNNTGDAATVRNTVGTTIDSCSWGSVGSGYKNC